MTRSELQKRALELPTEERVTLGNALLDSALPPLSTAQKAELDRRSQYLEDHPESTIPAEEVHEEIRRSLEK